MFRHASLTSLLFNVLHFWWIEKVTDMSIGDGIGFYYLVWDSNKSPEYFQLLRAMLILTAIADKSGPSHDNID